MKWGAIRGLNLGVALSSIIGICIFFSLIELTDVRIDYMSSLSKLILLYSVLIM